MARPRTRKKEQPVVVERDIIHPELKIRKYVGDKAMPAEEAKSLLGWMLETDYVSSQVGEEKIDDNHRERLLAPFCTLKDYEGNRIVLTNDWGNRPLTFSWASELAYDILNRRWRMNGESLSIGKTGRVLSGQHRLVALVLAYQIWAGSQEGQSHWQKLWDTEPVIETLVTVGVPEDPETTRTLDNVRKRTLGDVVFADTGIFGDLKPKDRKDAAKALQFAIKMIWHRTGSKNAFSPHDSHSECLDFLSRHERVKQAVRFICEENKGDKAISNFVSTGTAAGMLYLMASGESDKNKYTKQDPRSERALKFTLWDKAEEFWTCFAKDVSFHELRNLISRSDGTLTQKSSLAAKAWKVFLEGKNLTEGRVKLKTDTDNDGIQHLVEWPDFGGIDDGPPREIKREVAPERVEETGEAEEPEMTQEESEPDIDPPVSEEEVAEIEARKEEVSAAKMNGSTKPKKKRKPKKKEQKVVEEPVPEEEVHEEPVEEEFVETPVEEEAIE